MYVVGAHILLDFAKVHPTSAADMRALAARLAAGEWSDEGGLIAAFGVHAARAGDLLRLAMPWCGAEVLLRFAPRAELIIIERVERLPKARRKD